MAQGFFSILPIKTKPALWYNKKTFPPQERGMIAFFLALALEAALSGITQFRVLIVLTGVLAQASLILTMQKTGRRSWAACLISLLAFIACMR